MMVDGRQKDKIEGNLSAKMKMKWVGTARCKSLRGGNMTAKV